MPEPERLWHDQPVDRQYRAGAGEWRYLDGAKRHPGRRQHHRKSAATLDLSHAAAASSAGTLNVNGSLNLGSQNLTVAGDYNNSNFGTGNSFNKDANVTTTGGQIIAAGPTAANMQVISGANVTGGNTTTPTLDLGVVHVGDSTTYQMANEGTAANPALRGAIQTDVNGGNITGSLLSGSGLTAANFGPIAREQAARPSR